MQEENSTSAHFLSRLELEMRLAGIRDVDLFREHGIAQSTFSRWRGGSMPRAATLNATAPKPSSKPSPTKPATPHPNMKLRTLFFGPGLFLAALPLTWGRPILILLTAILAISLTIVSALDQK